MHKLLIAVAAVVLTSFTLSVSAAEAAKPKKINVLILTGDDVSVHPWREVSQGTRDLLQASGKFDVKICEDTGILESTTALKRYDVVYMAMYNAKTPTLSDSAKQNLIEYIKGGKGFVLSHLSSGSFKEWDEFRKLSGRYWVFGKGNSGHGPRSVFKVKIANTSHPITQGVQDFETDDELYARMQGDAPITVLATADSDWSKQTEPLAFTVEYGAGRVFHHTFGHDGKALANPNLQKLLQNGTQWAATGKVE